MKKSTIIAVLLIGWLCAVARADDRDVILNEIMYHPPNDLENLQYIELFNQGSTALDLSGWSFNRGVKFKFPPKAMLGPGAFLVICRSTNDFVARYGTGLPMIGNFVGRLSHGSEHVELVNAKGVVVDSVKYSDGGEWPMAPDGYAASLERICPTVPGDRADNWSGSKLISGQRLGGTPGRRNDSSATNLPPSISSIVLAPARPLPLQPTQVTATIADADGIESVSLSFRVAATGGETSEKEIPMTRVQGDRHSGSFQASIDPVPEGRLVRFRIKARDSAGAERLAPAENEPRPSFSYSTFLNTNNALIPFGYILHTTASGETQRNPVRGRPRPSRNSETGAARGTGTFVYVPPEGGEVQTFDHVKITPRKGGFKVRFHRDKPLNGMTTINVINEGAPRWILSEALAHELFERAGVPAVQRGHMRIYTDGRYQGHHLMIEQPNKNFLRKHFKEDSGNLYKLLWYGRNVVEQHEKKTQTSTGHEDLLKLIDELQKSRGAAQWEVIQRNFEIEEFINYFAVNMCIQNWDGFFNNYFLYHAAEGSGKWSIIPWDEDKTWGDYDGASLPYSWYEFPLTSGMTGDRAPGGLLSRFGQGPWGGASWWRPPGLFSGPLLANPEFRKRFLVRLGEICETVFTEEKLFPVIDAMEKRLKPEVRLRAQHQGENPGQSLDEFRGDMQSFRNQVAHRRKFILTELKKTK